MILSLLPLLIVLLSIIFIYLLLVNQRSAGSSYALLMLLVSKLSGQIVDGFTWAHETKTSIGQFNTVLTYFFLALTLVELLLISRGRTRELSDWIIYSSLLIIGVSFLFWKIFLNVNLAFSDYLFVVTVIIYILIRSNESDLRFIPVMAFFLLTIVFISACFRYQNPYASSGEISFGLQGPYHNFMWDLFGITQRFTGPYLTPNVLGYNIVLLCVLSGLGNTKVAFPSCFMGLILLLLSGSRISLSAFFIFLIFRFSIKNFDRNDLNSSNQIGDKEKVISPKLRLQRGLGLIVFMIVVSIVVLNNPTLTGRTEIYRSSISKLQGHLIFGIGPFSVNGLNGVESTYISLVTIYGLFGLLAVILLFLGLNNLYWNLKNLEKEKFKFIFVPFIIASSGELMLQGGPFDVGLIYILILLSIRSTSKLMSES